MSRSEFRYNKKRKHYAYLFKDLGSKRMNILISTKPIMTERKHWQTQSIKIRKNVALYHHPNPKKEGQFYLIPIIYLDDIGMFDDKLYLTWSFTKHDKRKVKRLKKRKIKSRR